jgi:chemotaxis protein MotB
MQDHGLRADQVAQVRGFADQQPRKDKDPGDPSNRRISLIVQYLERKNGAQAAGAAGKEPLPEALPPVGKAPPTPPVTAAKKS